MNGLQIFQNREFGTVRVVEYGGEPWFVARDLCAILGTETRDLPDILEHDEQRPIVDIIHTLNDSTAGPVLARPPIPQAGGQGLQTLDRA